MLEILMIRYRQAHLSLSLTACKLCIPHDKAAENISLIKGKTDASLYHVNVLFACKSWAQALQMRCYLKLLNSSYMDHVTSEDVRRKIQAAIGKYDEIMTLL